MENTNTKYAIVPVDVVGEGTVLVPDSGHTCMRSNEEKCVSRNEDGLFVECDEGKHFLCGQLDNAEENYIGFYLKGDEPGHVERVDDVSDDRFDSVKA